MKIVNNFGGIDKEIYNIGDILHKVGKNYLRALPIVCNEDGEDFEDYRIYGSAGGVGNRTKNCLEIRDGNFTKTTSTTNLTVTIINGVVTFDGTVFELPSTMAEWKLNLDFYLDAGTYYITAPSPLTSGFGRYIKKYDDDSNIVSAGTSTFTLSERTHVYLAFYIYDKTFDNAQVKITLVEGSTAPAEYVPYGYEVDMSVSGWSPLVTNMGCYINVSTGAEISSSAYNTSYFVPPMKGEINITITSNYSTSRLLVYMPYDINGNALTSYGQQDIFSIGAHKMTITVPDGAATIGISYHINDTDKNITYTSPIYVGSSPLESDEYIDYDSGKIYRMSGGVLTPTDPPVPLPSIPTVNGKTTVSYAGTGTAPEKAWFSGMEFEIEDVYFGDKHIFSVWGEYDGILPAQFNANGENLVQYQVYGNTGGVGDATSGTEPAGYKVPMIVFDSYQTYNGTLPAQYNANGLAHSDYKIYGSAGGVGDRTINMAPPTIKWVSGYIDADGNLASATVYQDKSSDFIAISQNVDYVYAHESGSFPSTAGAFWRGVALYDGNKELLSRNGGYSGIPIVFNSGTAAYARLWFRTFGEGSNTMLVSGSTAPAEYIPYGYEVDMGVSDGTTSTTTPIYIGASPLGEDEYVDYGEGKVYRRYPNIFDISSITTVKRMNTETNNGLSNTDNVITFTLTVGGNGAYSYNSELTFEPNVEYQLDFDIYLTGTSTSNNIAIALTNTAVTALISNEYFNYEVSKDSWVHVNVSLIPTESAGMLRIQARYIGDYIQLKNVVLRKSGIQPTDPPVPLPALPTVDGTNIVDYAGQSTAPSGFYGKYINSPILPIYIGSDPLGEDEYVDYGEQKIYRRTEQVMPSAPAETKTSNGITITCDGEGHYSLSGTATAATSIIFDVPEFIIPVSVGSGGNGTFSLFNTIYYPTQVSVTIRFLNGTTIVDYWNLSTANRTNTTYTAMSGKAVNKVEFYIVSGTDVTNGQVSPMFTDDGTLPSTFASYLQPADPPVPLPALPTVNGTNIVDYAGQDTTPTKFYAKYRKQNF